MKVFSNLFQPTHPPRKYIWGTPPRPAEGVCPPPKGLRPFGNLLLNALSLSLFLFLLLGLLAPVVALAQEKGVIEGQVTNKTPQGKSVASISVELKTLVGGSEQASTPGKTDAGGKFRFTGLNTSSNYSYQVTLNYQEADYSSETIAFGPGETTKTLKVTVWDATASDEALKVEAAHKIVQVSGGNLKVTEYYRILNQGDKTYVGSRAVPSLGKKETLRFSLPQGAKMEELTMGLMECCVSYEPGAFVDTMGVEPGLKEVAFIYSLKYSGSNYTLSTVASYPTDKFNMVVEDRGFQVSSPQIPQVQSVRIENNPFLLLARENLKKGENLQATLSGLPRPSPISSLRWLGIGLIAIALGFGIAYPLMRRRPAPVRVAAGESRRQLLQEVANLDDAFEAGKIEEEAYLRQRAQKMARLMKLSQGRQKT